MSEQPRNPTFGELLRGNLRVLSWVALGTLAAFLVWLGLRWLFPDIAWLRIPQH